MQKKRILGISFDEDVLEKIERRRGLVKRSTFVNDLLKKSMSGAESDKSEKEQ